MGRWAWAGFAGACAVGTAVAATAPRPPVAGPLPESERHAVFAQLAGEEPRLRKQAEHDWPTDPWSQDDAFHNLELGRVQAVAGFRRTAPSEIFRALDDGMRQGWPLPPGAALRTTVPPCRPRPITD